MFEIGKVFHLTHVVDDLDGVDRWYDDVFACERFYKGYEKAAVRNASLLVIADIVMEPVQLADVEGAERSPIGRFRTRFGQHFHSIAWYVDDIVATSRALAERGVRQVDVTGRSVEGLSDEQLKRRNAVWTHPKDTHALLEFAEPGFSPDPRLEPGWSPARWRDEHPLGIVRTSHMTVLFNDLADAATVYGDLLGGTLIHEGERPGAARSAFYALGEDTLIEAAQPLGSGSAEARDLASAGEGVFGVTFLTRDLDRAATFLEEQGQRVEPGPGRSLTLAPECSFGMVVRFSEDAVPGDPR